MKKIIKLSLISLLFIQATTYKHEDCTEYSYQDLVDTCYNHLKFHEGFRSRIYTDALGYKYIGYGHHLKKGENYINITKKQAEVILESDFKLVMNKVKQLSPYLSGNKLLAITLFSYNTGTGFYMKSRLKKVIESNQPIDNLITRYGYLYNSEGNLVISKRLLERRKFELWLYKL